MAWPVNIDFSMEHMKVGLCLPILIAVVLLGFLHGPLSALGGATDPVISNRTPRLGTEGKIVDAHDGCLQNFGDRYYLYGTAYLVYTSIVQEHSTSIEKLAPDYLSSTMEKGGFLAGGCQAPALFKRQNRYHALFDKTRCFCPEGTGADSRSEGQGRTSGAHRRWALRGLRTRSRRRSRLLRRQNFESCLPRGGPPKDLRCE
jgi:hypothetical protein